MAKSEMYGNSLIPLVLVAGILSGGLWRSNAPAESGKSGESSRSSTSDKSDAGHAPVPWISDLRPVLESLDDALGGQADSAGASPLVESATVALADKGAARDQEVLQAMAGLRTGLDGLSTGADATTCGGAALEEHARVLGAWMLADGWDGGMPPRPKRGRCSMNIGMYGVLPLLAVIAALFPEVGGTLFGWLEPLRKLSSL